MSDVKTFLWGKAIWKVLQIVAPVLASFGVVVAVPDTYEGFQSDWILLVIALVTGGLKLLEQRIKHAPPKNRNIGKGAGIASIVVVCLMLAGCVTTTTQTTLPDGSVQTTTQKAIDRVAMAKVADYLQYTKRIYDLSEMAKTARSEAEKKEIQAEITSLGLAALSGISLTEYDAERDAREAAQEAEKPAPSLWDSLWGVK